MSEDQAADPVVTSADERARALGIDLPAVAEHPARLNLLNAVTYGKLLFLSGTGPIGPDGNVRGRLGDDMDVDAGYHAGQLTAIRMLSKISASFGSLDAVARWLKVVGYVHCTDDFMQQPAVVNGFSDLIVSVYGEERGTCARTAIGVNALPLGIPVEVEAVVELR